jgi:enamine deaminase RidA (YjgF/YER057c/UK114 family)
MQRAYKVRESRNARGNAMRKPVKTHLPAVSSPLEWATTADGILYTAQIPNREDGSIETGDIRAQAELTLSNLRRTVEAAGGSMDDVTQVLVYLPDPSDFAGMNEVYARSFKPPYPNRATIVADLMVPGAKIEVVAYAHVGGRAATAAARPKAKAKAKRRAPAKHARRRR